MAAKSKNASKKPANAKGKPLAPSNKKGGAALKPEALKAKPAEKSNKNLGQKLSSGAKLDSRIKSKDAAKTVAKDPKTSKDSKAAKTLLKPASKSKVEASNRLTQLVGNKALKKAAEAGVSLTNQAKKIAKNTTAEITDRVKVESSKKLKEVAELKKIIANKTDKLTKATQNVVEDVAKEAEVAGKKLKAIKGKVTQQLSDKKDLVLKKMEERALEGLSQAARRWQLLYDKSKGIRAQVYEMSGDYKADSPIQHKVLGWGYVLSKKDNRIEVLFREGIKTLITRYSPN